MGVRDWDSHYHFIFSIWFCDHMHMLFKYKLEYSVILQREIPQICLEYI